MSDAPKPAPTDAKCQCGYFLSFMTCKETAPGRFEHLSRFNTDGTPAPQIVAECKTCGTVAVGSGNPKDYFQGHRALGHDVRPVEVTR